MSLNNKYGKCCGCPPRVNILREVGEWESASIRNTNEMKKLGLSNIHDYNNYLEEHGKDMIEARFKDLEENYTCKNNGDNIFFVDSSDYHQRFEEMNKGAVTEDVVPFDHKEPRQLLVKKQSNYVLQNVTNSNSIKYFSSA
jgi:hypothetical protein